MGGIGVVLTADGAREPASVGRAGDPGGGSAAS